MKTLTVLLCTFFLCACAGAGAQTAPKPIDLTQLPVAKFTHADLQNAAAMALAAGHPERQAIWLAKDAMLTAYEAQASACLNAIATMAPKPLATGSTVGAATLLEGADEALGQIAPAKVVITCKVIP